MNEHLLFLFAVRSPTCCRWHWGRWSWAPTSPPPPCGTAWLWSAPPSPTVDTTCPSCPPLNSTTSTTSSESTCPFSLLLFIFWTTVSLSFTVPSHLHRPIHKKALREILYILHGVWWIISHCASRPSLNNSYDNAKLLLNSHKVPCLCLVLLCLTWSLRKAA